jgi:hypothetical protein
MHGHLNVKDVGGLLCEFVPNCCAVAGIYVVDLMDYIPLCTAHLRENAKFSVKHNLQYICICVHSEIEATCFGLID